MMFRPCRSETAQAKLEQAMAPQVTEHLHTFPNVCTLAPKREMHITVPALGEDELVTFPEIRIFEISSQHIDFIS